MPVPKLDFNHAMIYARSVETSLKFYRDALGFKLIETYEHASRPVYARLRGARGGTIALHQAMPDQAVQSDGVRLYFEVKDLDAFCAKLKDAGVEIAKAPADMPWGWRHAYLNDPDGHEISLYWAGAKRFRKSTMRPAGISRAAAK